ncbi:MAG TPA: hypothetical protein VLA59_08960 [Patescibacteria group bacterium]|nr:hypothetical protein [Patescibacteria group bacterium]
MPRSASPVLAFVVVALVASACGSAASSDSAPSLVPVVSSDAVASEAPAVSQEPAAPAAGTDLDACELVTPADIAAALDLEPADVAEGDLTESPTSLSPGHTDCRYQGDWGGLSVSLTPEDGANLYDAARGSYADAADLEIAGAESAFWSADQKRGFFWKGAVTVMLQFSHITTGADIADATAAIGQAAMDRVD